MPKVPSSMTDILTYCPYRDTKKEPALRSGGISRHCVRVIIAASWARAGKSLAGNEQTVRAPGVCGG